MDASDVYLDTAAIRAGVSSAFSVCGTTNVDHALAMAAYARRAENEYSIQVVVILTLQVGAKVFGR